MSKRNSMKEVLKGVGELCIEFSSPSGGILSCGPSPRGPLIRSVQEVPLLGLPENSVPCGLPGRTQFLHLQNGASNTNPDGLAGFSRE